MSKKTLSLVYDKIYKTDSKGKTRVWYMEQAGSKYRTWDGLLEGKIKASDWREAIPTNVSRSNERSGPEQATFEIESTYKDKLSRQYHTTMKAISTGSKIFEPMLAHAYDPKKFKPGYAQPKLDGIRCYTSRDGMFSRNGKPIVSSPHIAAELKILTDAGFEFDGELYNHAYKENFNEISSLVGQKKPTAQDLENAKNKVEYHIYDLPSNSGTFEARSEALANLFKKHKFKMVKYVFTTDVLTEDSFNDFHGKCIEKGYEGSIWRDGSSLYQNKRTKDLLKRKDFFDDEYTCIRIEEGAGNWAGAAKRIICVTKDGKEFGAGVRGTYERGVQLMKENHKIVTVRYPNLTPDGIPRFGVVTKFHGNKREL